MLDVLAYYTLPIMLALCLMLLGTYYAQNYAGIIGRSLVNLKNLKEIVYVNYNSHFVEYN